jgi:hypothetical protein
MVGSAEFSGAVLEIRSRGSTSAQRYCALYACVPHREITLIRTHSLNINSESGISFSFDLIINLAFNNSFSSKVEKCSFTRMIVSSIYILTIDGGVAHR